MTEYYVISYNRCGYHNLYFSTKTEALKKYMQLLDDVVYDAYLEDTDIRNLKIGTNEKDLTKEINKFLED